MLELPKINQLLEDLDTGIDDLDFLKLSVQHRLSDVKVLGYVQLTKEYQRRLDKVAYYVYGNHGMMQHLMDYNGILNPFDVMDGDIIAIPDISSMEQSKEIEKAQTRFELESKASFNLLSDFELETKSKLPNRGVGVVRSMRVNYNKGVVIL